MKKILISTILSVLLISCSSSDESNNNANTLNPPSWIQGKWATYSIDFEGNLNIVMNVFRFKNDDFCTISSNTEICIVDSTLGTYTFQETISDTEYKITMTSNVLGGTTTSYHFIKTANNKIEVVNINNNLPNTPLIKVE